MKKVAVYGLPHCSTCRKAVDFLKSKGAKVAEFRNIKENKLAPAEIEKLAEAVGAASELFSKRAVKYREMKLNERQLSETEMLDLMADEYTFIKRPILVSSERAIAGFSEKSYEQFLKTNE